MVLARCRFTAARGPARCVRCAVSYGEVSPRFVCHSCADAVVIGCHGLAPEIFVFVQHALVSQIS
jgi:hypothetical protein